jgi:hypothetical protein
VERQSVATDALAQHFEDSPAIEEILEHHDEVVAVAHERVLPFHARPDVDRDPLVQHVVQENVRE